MPCPYTGTPPFPAHLANHPTPADHSSGSLPAETLDGPFFLGSQCLILPSGNQLLGVEPSKFIWVWCVQHRAGRSCVYCGSAQEEGIGNSVGGGQSFQGLKALPPGYPTKGWPQAQATSLCLGTRGWQQPLFWWPPTSPLQEIW